MNHNALPEPYTTTAARVDADRLYRSPDDPDLYAEVQARLHETNAQFNPSEDDLIDPSEALGMTEPQAVAAALLLAAVHLELRRAGITEKQAKARATRERNRAAKEAAAAEAKEASRRSSYRQFDVDKVHRHDGKPSR